MTSGIKHTTETFIKKSKLVHKDLYNYAKVEYKNNNHTEVIIGCSKHGEFEQKPMVHLRGGGCPKCRNDDVGKRFKGQRYTTIDPIKHLQTFIKRSNEVHNNYYDYSETDFANRTEDNKLLIICPKHGKFLQRHHHHWGGSGCPKCRNKYKKQDKWLDFLNIPNTRETRQVRIYLNDGIGGGYIISDGFISETNTIYEFWGNYHHGKGTRDRIHFSGKTMKELLKETNLKRRRIKNTGYNLIEIWEDEWDLQN